MPKNTVQFQRGLSLSAFFDRCGSESHCEEALFRWRWPRGFVCPECGQRSHCRLRTRSLLQCNRCHRQTSLTSGTLFASTKLPLRTWFLAIYLLTQTKNGVSALELSRQLGVSYNTAWAVKHKLLQAMKERDDAVPLAGRVELDDAYWGGQRSGGKTGRGSPGKTPFLAAVSTDERGRPMRMRLTRVRGFTHEEVSHWARNHLHASSVVISDGLWCFGAVTAAGCDHERIVTGGGPVGVKEPALAWVNTMLGNLKRSIHGSYHAVASKHLPRYLAEFSYRFNRRYDLPSMIPRLAYTAVRTPPMPYRLLKLAEVHG
jgi:transposase-like protein